MAYVGRNVFRQKVYSSAVPVSDWCWKSNHDRCRKPKHRHLYDDVYCQCECHAKDATAQAISSTEGFSTGEPSGPAPLHHLRADLP